MESKEVMSNAEYTLLQTTVEGKEVVAYPSTTISVLKGDSSWYPGNRRPALSDSGPPPNSILLPTAGNALQAVDRSVLEYVKKEELVAVSVPDNMPPGSTLLVATPSGRTIEAQVPQGVFAGHTFLVQVPPPEAHIVVVPGGAASQQVVGENTQVVPGHDVEDTDLHLQVAVTPDVEMATMQDTQQQQQHQSSQEVPHVTEDAKDKSVS